MASSIEKLKNLGIATAVVAAGLVAVKAYQDGECLRNLADGSLEGCIENPFESRPAPTNIEIEDLKVLQEKEIGTRVFSTFGEQEIVVQGKGKMDYKETNWARKESPVPWAVDGTYFMLPKPFALRYTPCIQLAENYREVATDPKGQYSGQVKLSAATMSDGTTHVIGKTGAIVACGMHPDVENKENKQVFKHDGKDSQAYEDTIEYIGENLFTRFATVNACPTRNIDIKGVERTMQTWIRGMLAEDPELRQLKDAPIDIEFATAGGIREEQQKLFHEKIEEFRRMKETLPDSHGSKRLPIHKVEIDEQSFAVNDCGKVVTPMEITGRSAG